MSKKWRNLIIAGIVILAIGSLIFWRSSGSDGAAAAVITGKVQKGDVRQEVTATGTVQYRQELPLSFSQGGKIIELAVKEGDVVRKGQVLARLDDTNLRQNVVQSEANLVAAEAKLQQLADGYNNQSTAQAQASLAKAEQALANAELQLTNAELNADPVYLENQVYLAEQSVALAQDVLANAEASKNSSSIQQAQNSLNQAQTTLLNAERARDGGAEQSLAVAQAAYRSAQADLTTAKAQVAAQEEGPKASEVQAAQAGVDQARAALEIARTNLNNATLQAPEDGVISSVLVQQYQNVGTNQIMTLGVGQDTLVVETAIDQADIALVKLGQKVDLTLDSAPDQHIRATVSGVAPSGTTVQSVTTFKVLLNIDEPSSLIYPGMNVNVSIIIAEKQGVLVIPSEAIKVQDGQQGVLIPLNQEPAADKEAEADGANDQIQGASTISVVSADTEFVPVETGLDDGAYVEIISGLTEGQAVVIGVRSADPGASGFGSGGSGMNSFNR